MYPGALVRLRAIEPDDAEAFSVWFNDPEVTYGLGNRYPVSWAGERAWAEAHGAPRYADGAYFAVETHDGVLLGSCGLSDTAYPENRCAQLGIVLGNKAYWNQGYGTDAVRTLCRFGFEEMNLHRIELLVFAFHEAARRVYEKVGFRVEAVARETHWRGGWHDDLHLALLEGELT